jgi:hypothetical protein
MTNKIILTLSLLSVALSVPAQTLPKEKTEKHKPVNGTNIFMVPPILFDVSNNFKGFQNAADPTSMIMVLEIPGPFSEVSKGFNAEMLNARGMEFKTKKEIMVGKFNGLLIELDQPANGIIFSKHILLYGNEKSSTLINGVYLRDSLRLGQKIKESILTTFVDVTVKTNPRQALNYSLNENIGGLKLIAVTGNGMLFNRDLKMPTESSDKATLVTDKSFLRIAIQDKKLFCISRLNKYPGDYSVLVNKGINEVTIDSLKGFELYAKNNEEDEEMYQVILFDKNGDYYIFTGTYESGNQLAISDLRNVIQTFARKSST